MPTCTRPADFGEAAALANPLRADAVEQRRRVKAAFAAMIAQAKMRYLIDDRCAAVGFCFGGGNVLELARDGADLAAAVSIHGDLKTALPAEKGKVRAALWWLTRPRSDNAVPEIAAWDEAATQQSYALTHQFLADAFAARL